MYHEYARSCQPLGPACQQTRPQGGLATLGLEGPFQLTQVYFCQPGEASGIGDPDLSGAARQLDFKLPTPTRCCVLVPTYPEAGEESM